jgi:hypothetical protein
MSPLQGYVFAIVFIPQVALRYTCGYAHFTAARLSKTMPGYFYTVLLLIRINYLNVFSRMIFFKF